MLLQLWSLLFKSNISVLLLGLMDINGFLYLNMIWRQHVVLVFELFLQYKNYQFIYMDLYLDILWYKNTLYGNIDIDIIEWVAFNMMKTNIYTTFAKSINLHTRSMKLRRRFDISNYAIPLSCTFDPAIFIRTWWTMVILLSIITSMLK